MGGVLFDGMMVIRPQARVRVDAQGLTPTVLGSANVLMAFGSAAGGEPKKVLSFTDPQDAAEVLRSGALLDAIKKSWNASQELPGASTIKVVRIDPATKSSTTLADAVPTGLLTLTSKDWGAHTTNIQVKVETGTSSGKKITVNKTDDGITEVFDNLANVAAAVAAINDPVSGSVLVDATLVLEGTLANVAYVSLGGGVDGTPSNSDWSDGFDLIDTNPADVYEVATSDSSVHALLTAQVALTTQNKYPGLCVLGHALGETDAQVIARAEVYAANKTGVVICTPGQKDYDLSGNVVTLASYQSTAPRVAGLICGLPIKGSPTYKTLAGLGLEKDWTAAQLDEFEQNGLLALENIPNRGLRITHGQTTYTVDGNPAFRDIATLRIRNLISITMKQEMERFVGEPGTKFTIAAIKAKAESIMVEALNAELITDGVDNAGNPQPAYRNIIVKFNSATGICYVEVECSPVTTINFVLATCHFKATNIVA
jgi:hypothetical protein